MGLYGRITYCCPRLLSGDSCITLNSRLFYNEKHDLWIAFNVSYPNYSKTAMSNLPSFSILVRKYQLFALSKRHWVVIFCTLDFYKATPPIISDSRMSPSLSTTQRRQEQYENVQIHFHCRHVMNANEPLSGSQKPKALYLYHFCCHYRGNVFSCKSVIGSFLNVCLVEIQHKDYHMDRQLCVAQYIMQIIITIKQ